MRGRKHLFWAFFLIADFTFLIAFFFNLFSSYGIEAIMAYCLIVRVALYVKRIIPATRALYAFRLSHLDCYIRVSFQN